MVFGVQQRLCHQGIAGIEKMLGGESVKHSDTFKYFGVILDSSLSLNQYIAYLKKKKVCKMLGMFSRVQPLLSIEAVNRLFKSMFLPILDYCDAVSMDVVKGMKKVWNADKDEFEE